MCGTGGSSRDFLLVFVSGLSLHVEHDPIWQPQWQGEPRASEDGIMQTKELRDWGKAPQSDSSWWEMPREG